VHHLHTYISGIATTQLTGARVVVTPGGYLGVLASSERYKTDITTMAGNTEKLAQPRPVSFHLKSEPRGAVQYGLIAEEVEKVYPELVIRDSDGRIQGVRDDELAPVLLNEVQKEQAEIRQLEQQVGRMKDLERELAGIHAAIAPLQAQDQLLAKR
jgi:hypothetical protein